LFNKYERLIWLFAVAYVTLMALPATIWYDSGELFVANSIVGQDMALGYDGVIKREANISYSVVVRDVITNEIVMEDAGGPFHYKVESQRPDPLLMSWWSPRTYGDGDRLDEGVYRMKTCWTVVEPFFGAVPPKTACVESSIFRVLPYEKDL
jgi:hypothetical protein